MAPEFGATTAEHSKPLLGDDDDEEEQQDEELGGRIWPEQENERRSGGGAAAAAGGGEDLEDGERRVARGNQHRLCTPGTPISKVEILEGFDGTGSGAPAHDSRGRGSSSNSSSSLQTDAQTVLNTMNLYVGVGLLSLGYAVKLGGWISLALLAVLGVILSYSAKLICRSFDRVPRKSVPSYPNLGATVYGAPGQWMVMLMGGAEFFGAMCLCLIIVWQSLEMLLPDSPICLGRICFTPGQAAILGSTFVMLPAVLIRTFSRLTSIGISGVISSVLLTSVVVVAYSLDPERQHVPPSSKKHATADWTNLPMAAGIMVICLSGHAGLPSLRRSMINPQHFESCVNIAFSFMIIIYAIMGGFAYLYFGDATQVLITGNLNEASSIIGFNILKLGSFSLSINQAITALVAISAYTTIPAMVYVIAELLVDLARGEAATHTPEVGDLIIRIVVLALGYIVAITAYNVLANVESIVGGVCSVSISLLLPSLFYFKLYRKDLSTIKSLSTLGMMAFGVICVLGIGTMNILQLVKESE